MKHRKAVRFLVGPDRLTFILRGGRDDVSPLGLEPHRELSILSINVYV